MMLDTFSFWEDWSASRRASGMRIALLLWVALWVAAFVGIDFMGAGHDKAIGRLERQYDKVAPLVREVADLQSRSGKFASLSPLAAAQQVSRDLKMEKSLASVRPLQIAGGLDGVQMLFQSLDHRQLLGLINALDERGGLEILSMNLNHRLDKPDHADVQLVLAR